MAIHAAVDVISLDTYVLCIRTSISPPLSRSKQTHDRRPRSDSYVRWTRVATHINTCTLSK